MRTIIISTDRSLFDEGSAIQKRFASYADAVGELHVIVFALAKLGHKPQQIGEKVFLYPTNSITRFSYAADAARIAKHTPACELVSSQDPFESGLAASRIAKERGIAFQVQVHTDFLSPHFARHSFLNRLRVGLAGKVLRDASCIRVVSERIAHSLEGRSYPRERIDILPLPLPAEGEEEERTKRFKREVLVVARLEPEKDIATALRAFSIAAKEDSQLGLIIVGSGSERERLERLASTLGIGERVSFEGSRAAGAYFNTADVFLLSSRYEGYGVALLEAARAGCPIVSTDVGAIGYELSHEAVLATAVGDAQGLAAGITSTFNDRDAAEHRSALANEAARRALTPEEYVVRFRTGLLHCADN